MGSILSYLFGYPNDDVLDPDTGLTDREKKIVRNTWKILRADTINTGTTIMISYFKKYPEYHKVFPSFKNIPVEDLPPNKLFQAHCQSIMTTLSNAFDALDDAALMKANLYIIGERHGRRNLGRKEFIELKGVMLECMRDALGSKFSVEVEATWEKTILYSLE